MKRLLYLLASIVVIIFLSSCADIEPDNPYNITTDKDIAFNVKPPIETPTINTESSRLISILNTSEHDINNLQFQLPQMDEMSFEFENNTCTSVLKPAESCEVTLKYQSTDEGEKYVKIIVTANNIAFDIEIKIVIKTIYQIEINDNVTNLKRFFKKGKPNKTLPPITIKNISKVDIHDLNFDNITNGFIINKNSTCTQNLNMLDTCNIEIDYPETDQAYGSYEGELSIEYSGKSHKIKLTAYIEPNVDFEIKTMQQDGVLPSKLYEFVLKIIAHNEIKILLKPTSVDPKIEWGEWWEWCSKSVTDYTYEIHGNYKTEPDTLFGTITVPIQLVIDGYEITKSIDVRVKPNLEITAGEKLIDNSTTIAIKNNSGIDLSNLTYKIKQSSDVLSFDYTDVRTTCREFLANGKRCDMIIKASKVNESSAGTYFIVHYGDYRYSTLIPSIDIIPPP